MLVKFFRRGLGAGSGPIDYLLGRHRDRKDARILHGDPVLTEQLINTTKYQQKYKAGVLSFEEQADYLTQEQKRDIMLGFEKTLFVGLDPDQYDILWVEHSDKEGRLELNFVIPGQELRSGKRLQPFYAGADLVRVNAYKNIINTRYGLSSPNEPERKRLVNPYTDNANKPDDYTGKPEHKMFREQQQEVDIIKHPKSRQALKDAINRLMLAYVADRIVTNRHHVVQRLQFLGLEIKRQTKQSISLAHPDLKTNVRLKGELYHEDFNALDFEPKGMERLKQAYKTNEYKREKTDLETWETGLEIKRAYHQALYGDIPPTEALKDENGMKVATEEQNGLNHLSEGSDDAKPKPADKPVPSLRPRFGR